MNDRAEPVLTIRTAVLADLPALRRVFRTASLSNAGDAPMLMARPDFLLFAGDGIAKGRTRVAVTGRQDDRKVVGFATVFIGTDGPELEDLFVDPDWRRRGVARRLVSDVVTTLQQRGHRHLWVTGNPHASEFYLAIGFVETRRVVTPLGTGLRMYLDLTRT